MINLILAQVPVDDSYRLTLGGWIVMLLSVGFVTTLLGWCIRRVMRESTPDKLHSQVDVDTHDTDNGH
ncbi:MAG TPA: hypothetical protein VHP11_12090 [Tepidisphaeraceae bacterium]|nr:hypothetical protein [Tepidisphaeraceae bacterium]